MLDNNLRDAYYETKELMEQIERSRILIEDLELDKEITCNPRLNDMAEEVYDKIRSAQRMLRDLNRNL